MTSGAQFLNLLWRGGIFFFFFFNIYIYIYMYICIYIFETKDKISYRAVREVCNEIKKKFRDNALLSNSFMQI